MSHEEPQDIDIMQMPLEQRLVLDHPESPTVAHARAVFHIYNEEKIPKKVIESIKETATRERDVLETSLVAWNHLRDSFPTLGKTIRDINLTTVADLICLSFGSEDYDSYSLRKLNLTQGFMDHGLAQMINEMKS